MVVSTIFREEVRALNTPKCLSLPRAFAQFLRHLLELHFNIFHSRNLVKRIQSLPIYPI